jgi:hypothetical protein
MTVGVQLVLFDFPAECVAVNAQELRGAGLVAVCAVQHALNEPFFELSYRLVEVDSPLYHLIDEPFQLIFHDDTLRWNVCA